MWELVWERVCDDLEAEALMLTPVLALAISLLVQRVLPARPVRRARNTWALPAILLPV